MSLNVSESLVPSGTPWTLDNVPWANFLTGLVGLVLIACFFAGVVLYFCKYYQNVGSKVYLEVYKMPDGRFELFRKYHNIGFNRFREEFGSIGDLCNYLERSLEGQFEVSED